MFRAQSFPGGASVNESACKWKRCRRRGSHSQVRTVPWRRGWQPTPVFLPGESHGQWSLVGYRPRDHKGLDMTAHTHQRSLAEKVTVCPGVHPHPASHAQRPYGMSLSLPALQGPCPHEVPLWSERQIGNKQASKLTKQVQAMIRA